jgi:hypothetical protein
MINPTITQAVAAEHAADLRREAAHQRFSRTVRRRRYSARHGEIREPTQVPAARNGDAEHADASDLYLASRH